MHSPVISILTERPLAEGRDRLRVGEEKEQLVISSNTTGGTARWPGCGVTLEI